MQSAADLHEAGLEALVGRRLATARRLLERSRALTTDPDLTARIDASLAFITAEQGDLASGLAVCDGALAGGEISYETTAVLHSQRALILLRMGDTSSAIEAFDVGIAMLSDPVELGQGPQQPGRRPPGPWCWASGGRRLLRAVTLLNDAGHPIEAAMAEHNLGLADLQQGDLVSALAHMDAVRPTLLPLSPVGVAISNQDRAEALMAAGLTRAAWSSSTRPLAPSGTTGSNSAEGRQS